MYPQLMLAAWKPGQNRDRAEEVGGVPAPVRQGRLWRSRGRRFWG